MPPRFIAKQLSCPSGLFAPVIARLMNRHNAKMNSFALQELHLGPDDRVLEIGFGGGLNFAHLVANAAFIGGLDRSAAMVQRARSKFEGSVRSGRADFRQGTIENIPFEAASFNKVCTVNTIYFWSSLDAGLLEIHRMLSPGGHAVIGFLPKVHMDRMGMPPDIFETRNPDDVLAAMANAGFSDVQTKRPTPSTPWNVIVAKR